MTNKLIQLLKLIQSEIVFIIRNFRLGSTMKPAPVFSVGDIQYRGMLPKDEPQVLGLYFNLNKSARLSSPRRWLYRSLGDRMMMLAVFRRADEESVVGMNMYYFNERDVVEGTIHEGFIGVSPDMAGKGIASNLRKMAIAQFEQNGFKGISSRISIDNLSSLVSAQKLGFEPIEKYFDSAMGQERYYLVYKFSSQIK